MLNNRNKWIKERKREKYYIITIIYITQLYTLQPKNSRAIAESGLFYK